MKVALGTVDFPDEARRFIRKQHGLPGLATRSECRAWFISHAAADLEAGMSYERDYEAERVKERAEGGAR